MILTFFLRFSTKFGEALFVSGSHTALGADDVTQAVPLQYFNDQFWQGQIEISDTSVESGNLEYRYILRQTDQTEILEWGNDRIIELSKSDPRSMVVIDTWNHAGEIANAFYTQAFREVLLKAGPQSIKTKPLKTFTHEFKVKAPILGDNEVLCLAGIGKELGDWKTDTPLLMTRNGNWWTARINLSGVT